MRQQKGFCIQRSNDMTKGPITERIEEEKKCKK